MSRPGACNTVTNMYGGIETGGTKTVCAVGEDGTIHARVQFPTGEDPLSLMDACARFFTQYPIDALGVGTFGPCDTDPGSATYGRILATPKPGWSGVDLRRGLTERIPLPCAFTSDVSAAAVGEARHGAGLGVTALVYLTIGTGIGAGVIVDGSVLHGVVNLEVGHMLLPFDLPGVCPFHGNCWEGLASGPALQARLGFPAAQLADDDPAWDLQARVVAAGLHNIACALSPAMVIIGGGLGSRGALHRRLPALVDRSLAGYVPTPSMRPPGLGSDAGVIGAMTLAQDLMA